MIQYQLINVDDDTVYDTFDDKNEAFTALAIADQFEPGVNHGIQEVFPIVKSLTGTTHNESDEALKVSNNGDGEEEVEK